MRVQQHFVESSVGSFVESTTILTLPCPSHQYPLTCVHPPVPTHHTHDPPTTPHHLPSLQAYIMVEHIEENFPSDRELVKIAQRTLRALSPDGWRGGADLA